MEVEIRQKMYDFKVSYICWFKVSTIVNFNWPLFSLVLLLVGIIFHRLQFSSITKYFVTFDRGNSHR